MSRERKSIKASEEILELEPDQRPSRLGKQWLIAKRRAMSNVKDKNFETECYYNLVTTLAKSLFATLQDDYSKTVIEIDYRKDLSQALSMHTFLTSSFYFELECGLNLHYSIRYDFHCCPFGDELRLEIQRLFQHFPSRLVHSKRLPNCDEYFRRTLFAVNNQHIVTL